MKSMKVKAFAKINLTLEILDRLESGYHKIETVLQRVSLFDEITIEESEQFKITCTNPLVPTDKNNSVYKAWKILGGLKPVHIHIEKNIPLSSGLGGESADAAAVLKALNELWNLGKSKHELMELGARIGMDVPFCLLGGTALGVNRGEVVKSLPSFGGIDVVICTPRVDNYYSTKEAYSNFDVGLRSGSKTTEKFLGAEDFCRYLTNDFEKIIFSKFPAVKLLKNKMIECGAGSLMSGHGPSVYGIFDRRAKAEETFNKLREEFPNTFLCETI